MAGDTSRNPEDQAAQARLEATLREAKGVSASFADSVRKDTQNLSERKAVARTEAAQQENFARRVEAAAAELRTPGVAARTSVEQAAASLPTGGRPPAGGAEGAALARAQADHIRQLEKMANAESLAAKQIEQAQAVRNRVQGLESGVTNLGPYPRQLGPGAPQLQLGPGPPIGPQPVGAAGLADVGLGAARVNSARDALNEQNHAAEQARLQQEGVNGAWRKGAQDLQLLSGAYRDHGALTAEFIEAARKGQVGMSELGYQVSTTIAKFAGWTAAAGAVYGVLGAFNDLKTGATAANTGVANLSRFITDLNANSAIASFQALSKELNVGIGDVAEAEQAFARIFHNQADTVTAARVSLLATKLDNISLADSYRYLTSLTQEYGLSASQLPGVFDQISAAQRQLGARVSDSLPALARSAAAIKNAGGGNDPSQLIALLSTTEVSTGQTGTSVGTAFYRGASRFFPQANNQATIKSFGVDPTQGFTQALIDAITKATKEGVDGTTRRDLAQAFFGPQFGGRFAGIFNQGDRLQTAIEKTSPEAAAGSANQELKDKLRGADEVLKSFGNSIQRLGASLAGGGALDPLLGFVKVIGLVTNSVSDLVKGMTDFLGAIGSVPAALLEATAVIRTLRRFDVGGNTGLPFIGQTPARREQIATVTGLEDEQAFLAQQRTSAIRQGALASYKANLLKEQIAAAEIEGRDEEEIAALKNRQAALSAEYKAAVVDQTTADALLAENAAATAAVKNGRFITAGQVQATAAGYGVPAASTLTEAEIAAGAGAAAGAGGAAVGREGTALQQAIRSRAAAFSASAENFAVTAASGANFVGGTKIAETAGKAATGFARVTESMANLATASVGLGGALIGAFAAFEFAKALVGNSQDHYNASIKNIGAATNQDQAAKAYNQGIDGGNPFSKAGSSLHEIVTGDLGKLYDQQINLINVNAKGADEATAKLSQINAGLRAAAKGGPGQQVAGLSAALQQLANDKLFQELDPALYAKAKANIVNGLKRLQSRDPNANPFLGDSGPKQTLAELTQITDQAKIGSGISSGNDLDRLIQGAQTATFRFTSDPVYASEKDALKNLQALQDKAITGIKDTVAQQTAALLDSTYDPQKIVAGYTGIINEIKQRQGHVSDRFKNLSGQAAAAEKRLAELQKERGNQPLAGISLALPFGLGSVDLGGSASQLDVQIKAEEQKIAKLKEAMRKTGQYDNALIDQMNALIHATRDARVTLQNKTIDDTAALAESTAPSQAAADAIAIKADAQKVAIALQNYGASSNQYKEALTKANQTIASAAQNTISLIQAQSALNTANIQTLGPAGDLARQRSDLAGAQKVLAAANAEKNNPHKQADILAAETAIANLNRGIAQTVQDQARQAQQDAQTIFDAHADAAIAGLNDPLQIDKATLAKDQHDLAALKPGQFNTISAYNAAVATQLVKVAQDRKKTQQDIISQDLATAKFEHDIHKLSDEQYIAQLQQILKLKGITTAQKQQLLLEIYNLQHANDGNLNLDVGNISLPTVYQVRQAILGRSAGNGSAIINHTANVTVNVQHAGDVSAVAGALDKSLGTSITSAARAAGVI